MANLSIVTINTKSNIHLYVLVFLLKDYGCIRVWGETHQHVCGKLVKGNGMPGDIHACMGNATSNEKMSRIVPFNVICSMSKIPL